MSFSLLKDVTMFIDDDACFYTHSWRNNVIILFGTLSSFLTLHWEKRVARN